MAEVNMTTSEFAARIEQLVGLCDRAISGEEPQAPIRDALRQALSDEGCPLRQPTSSGYAETIRQEAGRRADIVLGLDLSTAAYRAAVTGLKRHLVALLDASP
jgi:hypothetical protein